ncbi:MAG TPA: hypothetical protein PKD00_02735 [Burkholderiales bacterium]|nr:hypothetical protein [Burkholderiales bacterium]
MTNNHQVDRDVLKYIKTLPTKQQSQLLTKIIELFNNPLSHGGEKLTGYKNYYRQDIGEYRICYTVMFIWHSVI